jgi:AcrR family transcriptional regulator
MLISASVRHVERDPQPPGSKGAQTRRAILDAAVERFGREGFRSASVADIARDAGVGGTVAYAYFPNKRALFLAALDEDAAGVIEEGVSRVVQDPDARLWRQTLIFTLVEALDRHPLARRVLAGLEPEATVRMLELPALAELRKAVAERLRSDQAAGTVRQDIDPVAIATGAVAIILSLLMAVLQFGTAGVDHYGQEVFAVFEAALDPVGTTGPHRET